MTRCSIMVALLAAFAIAPHAESGGGKEKEDEKEIILDGSLKNAPKEKVEVLGIMKIISAPVQVHVVPLKKGKTYSISMTGMGFKALVRLDDKNGKELGQDEAHDLPNALIRFNCPKDEDYRIVCSSVQENVGKQGTYVLNIKLASEPVAAHLRLLDKPAPDFQGDFALNGKAAKPSDFMGKVVLLNFWAVHSRESVAMLPRLSELYKTHKAAGLEVVGVTYYNSELGHKFGFDPDAGKLTNLNTASPQTDQAMLAAFAAYHQLEYLLLVMHEKKALKTFADYMVNGVPQMVLIDRKGMVRYCFTDNPRVRGDMNDAIGKLLAERLCEVFRS